jgi:hypothetical protein
MIYPADWLVGNLKSAVGLALSKKTDAQRLTTTVY